MLLHATTLANNSIIFKKTNFNLEQRFWGPSLTIFTKPWWKTWDFFPIKQWWKAYFLEQRDLLCRPVGYLQCIYSCKLWNNLYWIFILYEILCNVTNQSIYCVWPLAFTICNVTSSSIKIKSCYFSSGIVSHFKSLNIQTKFELFVNKLLQYYMRLFISYLFWCKRIEEKRSYKNFNSEHVGCLH